MPEQTENISLWSKIKKSKKLSVYAGVGFLVLIALVAGVIAVQTKQSKDTADTSSGGIVFTIEGKKFYRDQMLNLVKYQIDIQGVSEDDALSQAYDLEKEIIATEKSGIKPSQTEIKTEKDRLVTKDLKKLKDFSTKYEPWFSELAKLNAAKRYVGGEFSPTQKGYILLFSYKAEDEAYAKGRAEYYQQAVNGGQITAEKAVQEIQKDSKVAPPKGFMNSFGHDQIKSWDQEIQQPSIKDYIRSLTSTGVSPVQSGSNETGLPGSYYYVIDLNEVPSSKVVSLDDFNNTLKSLNATYTGFTLSSTNNGGEQK